MTENILDTDIKEHYLVVLCVCVCVLFVPVLESEVA